MMRKILLLMLIGCAPKPAPQHVPEWVSDTQPPASQATPASAAGTPTPSSAFGAAPAAAPTGSPLAAKYKDTVDKIVAAARADRGAYEKLAYLTDHIGNRISGSESLIKAIAWAAKAMKDDGHENVHTEKVMVPHWVRGAESAEITAPISRPMHILGLGGTVATPKAGITAPVVVVHNWDELDAKQAQVKGAIVLFDVAMPKFSEEKGPGYGETVQYRGMGPVRAAKYGAVAVLMRSVTAHSLRTPHTGATNYKDDVTKIPAVAVTVEDSTLLARLAAEGPVKIHLRTEGHTLPDAESANVIGELRGRENPDEVVVIGGHIDSWDVGQGAHDDGAGIVTMMQALTTLRKLGLQPRRTIRVVCFTNEENGTHGGKTYAKDHADELARTVLAVESDSGGFAPRGFGIGVKPELLDRAKARIGDVASLLAPTFTLKVAAGHGGSDIGPMEPGGVPVVGLEVDNRTYFDYHHTDADTLDKVDPAVLADDVAAVAALAYVVADMPGRVDAP
jgi:carboxypeptidase Q